MNDDTDMSDADAKNEVSVVVVGGRRRRDTIITIAQYAANKADDNKYVLLFFVREVWG